ncbi:MAG: TonB-dependent receptor [Spirosomaceae bacterium]|nr:TonB-dependent receptor [Spirosomataceae bacterium]
MQNYSTYKPILLKIMRLSLLQLCLAFVFASISFAHEANAQELLEQEISISVKDQSLIKVLKEISNQTDIKFVYSSKLIGTSKLVSIDAKKQKLSAVLQQILKPLSIEYVINGEKIILNRRIASKIEVSPNAVTVEPRKVEITPDVLPKEILQTKKANLATGTLQGKITDEKTGEALPGASIYLKGTTKGGVTNLRGEYIINLVPSGKQTFVVSYIGYQSQEINADVNENGVTVQNIKLREGTGELAEVVVRGSLEGQQKALNQQRTSDNIKNIISADLIGRFPDLNVAEALQRIPGINIERDRGEGGEVQMRGAPPSFTTININGEQIPGTQTDGQRNEELSLIPVDQLSSIEVTKAITSDMDGDNIGGTVDFRTPSGKNLNWKGKAEVGGGYNNIVQRTSFIGKFGINRRFMPTENMPDGRFGFNLGGSYFGSNLGRDRITYNYTSQYTKINGKDYVLPTYYRLRDLENFRSRTGVSAAMDYKFSPKSELYFNYMYSRRYDFDEEARTQFDFNTARFVMDESIGLPTGNTATTVRRFINPRFNDVKNHSVSLGGNHGLGKATIDYLLFWSQSHNDAFVGRVYDLRSTTAASTFTGWGSDFANVQGVNYDIHDPFNMRSIRNYTDQDQVIKGRNFSGKINLTIPYMIGDKNSSIKFGGKYRTISNRREIDNKRYNFVNDGTVNVNSLFARYTSSREDNTFLKNSVRFGPTLNYEGFDQFIASNQGLWRFDENTSANESIPAFYDANETVFAGYLMNKINFNKFMLLTGVRYERTVVDYISRAFEFNAQGNVKRESVRDIAGGTNFDFFLPNVHLKYSINQFTNIRAALTYSYARSNFADLAPVQSVNVNNLTINLGNPNLKPASSTNFDLMFEHYFKNVGIISGGVFNKQIRNFNFDRTFTEDREVFVRDDATGAFVPFKETFSINQTQNGETANVRGFEFNLQTNLSFLPGILKGIGLYANYTFTDSKATTFDRQNVRLPGQARHTGNAALSFDYKKLTLRGSFNFNGGVIRALGPAGLGNEGDFDTYRADRYQLDLSASFAITKKIRAYAEFINLTNRPDVEYFGIRSRVSNLEYFDWWNRFGLSYNF